MLKNTIETAKSVKDAASSIKDTTISSVAKTIGKSAGKGAVKGVAESSK